MNCYKIGDIYLQFDEETQLMFDMWKWKIDPWKTTVETNEVIEIKSENIKDPADYDKLLSQQDSGFFQNRIYQCADHIIWQNVRKSSDTVYLQYTLNNYLNEIYLNVDETHTNGTASFEYLCQIMPCVMLKHNMLTIHSSLFEYEGKGIIVCAPSGTGKTTHARLWRDTLNALIINGDRAVCQYDGNKWIGIGTPWSGTSGEQMNRKVPLKAIVVLHRGQVNKVKKLDSHETLKELLPHVLVPYWHSELTSIALGQFDMLLKDIPVYRLDCLPNEDAVYTLKNAILSEEE